MKHKSKIKAKVKTKGKLSARLNTFFNGLEDKSITLGEMRDMFSGTSYWLLIFIFAAPIFIPLPTPGLSAVVSLPLLLIAAQVVVGKKSPWLPKRIVNKKLNTKKLQKTYKRIEPYLKKLEVVIKARMSFLIQPPADRFVALICTGLAILVMMPLPFSNAFPALAIGVLALAMLMRDGLLVLVGLVLGVGSAALVFAISEGVVSGVGALFG